MIKGERKNEEVREDKGKDEEEFFTPEGLYHGSRLQRAQSFFIMKIID